MGALRTAQAKLKAAWNDAAFLLTLEHWALALMACCLVLAITFLLLGK